MAWTFGDEVKALTNYDAMGTDDSISGEDFYLHTNQWLKDGAKEIISILPLKLKERCATISILNATNGTTLDMDTGEILNVTRLSANSGGYYTPCRKIPGMYGDFTNDSTNLMYYATVTDPIYWITSNSSGASTLFVKPTTTDAQPANVYRVEYPQPTHGDAAIANFPNEAEPAVVLYAAIKALCYKMAEMHTLVPVHSEQDGAYNTPGGFVETTAGSQGWEVIRHWIETEEDTELAATHSQALTAEMQQFVGEYQWYQSKHNMLQQEYQQKLTILSGRPTAPQSPPQQEQREGR